MNDVNVRLFGPGQLAAEMAVAKKPTPLLDALRAAAKERDEAERRRRMECVRKPAGPRYRRLRLTTEETNG